MEPGVTPAGMAGRIRSEYSADGCVRQVLFKTSTVIDVMARNGDVLTNGLLGVEKDEKNQGRSNRHGH